MLYEVGMTQEQVMAMVKPAPADRYRLIFRGFLINEEAPEGQKLIWPTKKGGKMVKAKFAISSPDPAQNGKMLIYMGLIGSFSFANLCRVLPIMSGTGIDEDAAIGSEIEADVSVSSYTNSYGESVEKNDITKMYLAA